MRIETEWVHCPDCGYPIIERDGVRVDAVPHGVTGQTDTDVEHECRER
jgi:uncharacterized Zn finger protein (UPF0148 family)